MLKSLVTIPLKYKVHFTVHTWYSTPNYSRLSLCTLHALKIERVDADMHAKTPVHHVYIWVKPYSSHKKAPCLTRHTKYTLRWSQPTFFCTTLITHRTLQQLLCIRMTKWSITQRTFCLHHVAQWAFPPSGYIGHGKEVQEEKLRVQPYPLTLIRKNMYKNMYYHRACMRCNTQAAMLAPAPPDLGELSRHGEPLKKLKLN